MTEKILPKGYRTVTGHIMTDAEVELYNSLTLDIAGQGTFNKDYVESMKNYRHKILSGFFKRGKKRTS